jgi:3-hydroxybutyryl-CoA dehydrogenase
MARVTIIGTGLLGSGIAEVLIRAGHRVVLHDFSVQTLNVALRRLEKLAESIGATVESERSLDTAVESADFILEAVTENLELKQSLFERAGDVNRHAILMSNSSVLSIGQISRRTHSPERAVGTHWWNPPQLIPVVEVIRGPRTIEDVMRRTIEFHAALGKMPVRVERDVPGFIGNRIQHALWREALALVGESGFEPKLIDRIVAAVLGDPFSEFGPWEQMRRVGWPQVMKQFEITLPEINSDPTPTKLLREKVAQGQLGAKAGQGFLKWATGEREHAAARLSEHVATRLRERAAEKTNNNVVQLLSREVEPIARRLRVAVWREAISLVENMVCSPADVDRVVCNTIGLRLTEMGPIRNADYVGLDLTLAIHEAVLPSLESGIRVPSFLVSAARDPQQAVIPAKAGIQNEESNSGFPPARE